MVTALLWVMGLVAVCQLACVAVLLAVVAEVWRGRRGPRR